MATLTATPITRAGGTINYPAASAGGDVFLPGSDTFIHIINGGGGSITATVVTPRTTLGLAVADVPVTVGAGADKMFGPFPAGEFADPTDGLADITYSGVTSVSVAVALLQQP